jgi:uncharacterized membrane protein YoaK (UPF0700 family)
MRLPQEEPAPGGKQDSGGLIGTARINSSRVISDAARAVVPGRTDPDGMLPPLLLILTVVTGVVDAVSYLKFGHVFVANMTGNIVFLGFGLAGAGGLSIAASLVSLAAFLVGAGAGGRLGVRLGAQRGHLLTRAIAIEFGLVTVAMVTAAVSGDQSSDAGRYALIVLLALALGLQNAVARRLGVADLTTTVLTLTLTGIAADSRPAGGNNPRLGRRLASVAAMLAGAALGGLLVLHVDIAAPLGLAAGLLLLTGLASQRYASRAAPQVEASS